MKEKKSVILLCDYFYPGFRAGGPIQSLRNLSFELKKHHNVVIFTRGHDFMCSENFSRVRLNDFNETKYGSVFYATNYFSLIKALMAAYKDCIYIHLNSVFSIKYSLIPLIINAVGFRNRVILSPRGELLDGALANRKISKLAYVTLVRCLIRSNDLFHGSSENEVFAIGQSLKRNAFLLKNLFAYHDRPPLLEPHKKSGELDLVMMCRVSPIKNIELLIKALAETDPVSRVSVAIYGAIDDVSYHSMLADLARAILPGNVKLKFFGAVDNDLVKEKLSKAHCLASCSFSENFGHSIVEALGASRPVLCSTGSPWAKINEYDAGYCIDLDVEIYKEKIQRLIELDHQSWEYLSSNAYRLFVDEYQSSIECLEKSPFLVA